MTHYAPCSRQPRICCTVQLFFFKLFPISMQFCLFEKKKSKSYKSLKKNYKNSFSTEKEE